MIQVTCAKCQAVLTLDDAFAGGVCRCKHCGLIQTVPNLPPGSAGAQSAQSDRHANCPTDSTTPPTEACTLEELAKVIAGNPPAGGEMLRPVHTPEHRAITPALVAFVAGFGTAMFLFGVLVTWVVLRNDAQPCTPMRPTSADPEPATALSPRGDASGQPAPATQPAPRQAGFLGLVPPGPSVVYLLDRGSASVDTLEYTKLAAIHSAENFGADMKFQIIFWTVDGQTIAWPEKGLAAATPENIAACRLALDGVYAFGQSLVDPAIGRAMQAKPADIVLTTSKGGLGTEFVQAILKSRGTSPVRIHTVCLGSSGSPEALKELAQKTGGQFRLVSIEELRNLPE